MPHPFNSDGSIRSFTPFEIAAMRIETADVKDGSHPSFRLDSKGCSIDRAFWCDWSQRDNAIALFLGGAALAGTAPNYFLSRVEPAFFPDPGYSQYFAIAADVMGGRSAGIDSPATGIPAYRKAKLKVRYEQVFFTAAPDGTVPEQNRYVEQLPSAIESSRLSLPGSMLAYATPDGSGPDVPIPYGVGRIEAITKVAYKWHRVPFEAWRPGAPLFDRVHGDAAGTSIPFIGTVNRFPALGYPAGYALFDGVEEEIVPDPVRGFLAWDLTYHFSIKNVVGLNGSGSPIGGGHNYLYYPGLSTTFVGIPIKLVNAGYFLAIKGGTWVANGSIPDGLSLFNERDHNQLWNVGA